MGSHPFCAEERRGLTQAAAERIDRVVAGGSRAGAGGTGRRAIITGQVGDDGGQDQVEVRDGWPLLASCQCPTYYPQQKRRSWELFKSWLLVKSSEPEYNGRPPVSSAG